MKIEVRNGEAIISGYVNAVERFSKPLTQTIGGVTRHFVEKIRAGAFRKSLQRNGDVAILLNHSKKRELARTSSSSSATLVEDNIGLHAEIRTTDAEVVEKARSGHLSGWSFGFKKNNDEWGKDGDLETRTVTDLNLVEVSLLDDTRSPAYEGTSVETRAENGVEYVVEFRDSNVDPESANTKNDELRELVTRAENVVERLEKVVAQLEACSDSENSNDDVSDNEDNPEEKDESDDEQRGEAVDYSDFERRINSI